MNARGQQNKQRRSRLSLASLLLLGALLLFPFLAGLRLAHSLDPRVIAGYVVAICVLTFWLYWHDKRQAENDGWRTPEYTLHLAELFGGWPAAFLAQRAFRHKISKTRYQMAFWTIVSLHQAASFDFLSDWHYSQAAIKLLQR
jgi:uncharacterized membrane protein YsdA (DUF1294 family)